MSSSLDGVLDDNPSLPPAGAGADPVTLPVVSDGTKTGADGTLAVMSSASRTNLCETGEMRGKSCRVDWVRILAESLFFCAGQNGGNIAMDRDTRRNLTTGSFWGDYATSVENYRWSRWKDDDPTSIDYFGHPMMGGIVSALYEQNDPKQRGLTFENSSRYWNGRLKAMGYSALYSAQWKVGPVSEASIGNTGIGYYFDANTGVWTNGTGMQDFFVTPVGGFAWNVCEDLVDRFLFARVTHHTGNRIALFFASFMTPARSTANLARFRAPYSRDADTRHTYR